MMDRLLLRIVRGMVRYPALIVTLSLLLAQGCTDTVMNPTQVVPVTGLVYRGNGLYKDATPVLDSSSGKPVHIIFARLAAGETGDGSHETPFSALAPALRAADPGDIVFVYRGVDPGLGDFRIPDGVRLYSDGPLQRISTRNVGVVTLPYSGSEPPTHVKGTATLGSNSEIAGFHFVSRSGSGVYGSDVSNVLIRDNRFESTRRQAVHLLNVAGRIVVHDNQVFATTDSTSPGISIHNEKVVMNAWVYHNAVQDPSGDGIKILTTGTGVTVATIDSNTVLRSVGSGIKFFSYNNANTTAVISNNVVSRNRNEFAQDAGIRFGTFNDIRGNVKVLNNRVFNCASNGVFIGSEDQARTEVNVSNNAITECVGNGIFVGAQQTSFQKTLISNNVCARNKLNTMVVGFPTGQGIFTGSLYSGRVDATIVFNRVYENEQIGIFCATFNAGKTTSTISDNLISNNAYNGLEMNCGLNVPPPGPDQVAPPLPSPGENNAQFRVYNNVIAGNRGEGQPGMEGSGIQCLVFNGASVETILQNNHVNGNGNSNGGYAGCGILVFHNSTATFALRHNTFSGNPASPALNVRTFGAIPPNVPDPTKLPVLCLELLGNVSDTGFLLTKDPETSFTATLDGNAGPMMIPFTLNSNPACKILQAIAGG
jgi:hypothetical protein